MVQRSGGILLYRHDPDGVAVLLVHPGGPYWQNKDVGAWQIPKGLIERGEDARAAALREVEEELGVKLSGHLEPLGEVRQAGGKRVEAFALEQDLDPATIVSNMFEMEWPPRSGSMRQFPEIDRARWFTLLDARETILTGQLPFLDRLGAIVRSL
jgi:predicted NUDIX family NTP pyrophosphohydrolase